METRELWPRVLRAAALSDHMGDMANGLCSIAEVFDLNVPSDEDDDHYDLDAIDTELEAMGARGTGRDERHVLHELHTRVVLLRGFRGGSNADGRIA